MNFKIQWDSTTFVFVATTVLAFGAWLLKTIWFHCVSNRRIPLLEIADDINLIEGGGKASRIHLLLSVENVRPLPITIQKVKVRILGQGIDVSFDWNIFIKPNLMGFVPDLPVHSFQIPSQNRIEKQVEFLACEDLRPDWKVGEYTLEVSIQVYGKIVATSARKVALNNEDLKAIQQVRIWEDEREGQTANTPIPFAIIS